MPWTAGLHAVLPRLIRAAADNQVAEAQVNSWKALLATLPPLPMGNDGGTGEVFAAAQEPFPPHAGE